MLLGRITKGPERDRCSGSSWKAGEELKTGRNCWVVGWGSMVLQVGSVSSGSSKLRSRVYGAAMWWWRGRHILLGYTGSLQQVDN